MHPYLAFLFHRDYFRQPDSSLSCSFVPQGLFPPTEFIPILHFFATEIISTGQIHPFLAFLFHRDYFRQPDSSPSGSFVPQGLFQPAECISVGLFCAAGIISTDTMACPASHKPMALCSSFSSLIFLSSPPAYPVKLPSAPTTRWHGMIIEMGLRPTAPPTACADILDIPCFRAICPAISP